MKASPRRLFLLGSGVLLAVLLALGANQFLPTVIERPAAHPGDTLAFFMTGDGGWSCIERKISRELNGDGISVVGFNSLRYFWTARTPQITAADVERILKASLARWTSKRILMIGYSRGADVVPFVLNRLPPELRQRIVLVALLGVEPTIDFDLHLWDSIWGKAGPADVAVLPEARRLDPTKVICVAGTEDPNTLCPQLATLGIEMLRFPGGHHFGGHYREIARSILIALAARRR
jgi:type IV secretory pathway VirJ component